MSQAGSLGVGTFDLNSQSGVMAVLVAVRQSALSPAQKSELRDLVFLYSNGGGDVTVRRALEQKISTYGLAPVVLTPKASQSTAPAAKPAPVRPYGNSRPSPQFAPVATIATPGPVSAPVASAAPVIPPLAPVASTVPTPEPPPAIAPAPVSSPAPAPEPSTPPVVPVATVPVVPVTPAPVATPTPVPVAAPATSSVDAALVRIRDIKAAVNQKVGNPVNLVDIDNAVGREYMVAMLEAMKRVAGNTPGDLGVAMARLETAYAAVEAAIAAHGTAAAVSASTPAVVAVPAAPSLPVQESVVAPIPASVPVMPDAPQPTPAAVPVAQPVYVPPAPPVAPPPVITATPAPTTTPVESPRFAAMAAEPASTPAAQTGFRAASLADDPVALRTPQDLPDPASLATSSVSGDPLFTREVDAGLEQLLSEWVIFKKSGLFGTGPRGREHPLFKTLASLSIPIILAGRYDGATPEIRQSITDYMNGWRYEQGIIYEQDEAFEHYLRRVIHHIIDLQKRRRQA